MLRMKIMLISAGLLLVGSVWADKPDPYDCPCFDTNVINVVGWTECVSESALYRESLGGKQYQKQFSWVQATPRLCGELRIESYEYSSYSSCTFVGGYDSADQCSFMRPIAHWIELTPGQISACEAAMRIVVKEINRLPGC